MLNFLQPSVNFFFTLHSFIFSLNTVDVNRLTALATLQYSIVNTPTFSSLVLVSFLPPRRGRNVHTSLCTIRNYLWFSFSENFYVLLLFRKIKCSTACRIRVLKYQRFGWNWIFFAFSVRSVLFVSSAVLLLWVFGSRATGKFSLENCGQYRIVGCFMLNVFSMFSRI